MAALTQARIEQLKSVLDAFSDDRGWKKRITADPVEFPHRYRDPRDIEVVALLSASLAYGRAQLFKPKIDALLTQLGPAPAHTVANLTVAQARELLGGFVYRFNVGADVATLLLGIGQALNRHGSLERTYTLAADQQEHWRFGLAAFSSSIITGAPSKEIRKALGPTRGLHHLLPSAAVGPAKRQHLFLRWLVRGPDDIDLGVWQSVNPSTLIIPLDTHVARLSKLLGFTRRNDVSWKTADEVTAALRQLDPEDPTRYDFALCHYGMSGVCPVAPIRANCVKCQLKFHCRVGRRLKPST